MFSERKWLNIKDRVNFHKMFLVCKCRNVLVQQYCDIPNREYLSTFHLSTLLWINPNVIQNSIPIEI